jgi:hypothetical protein
MEALLVEPNAQRPHVADRSLDRLIGLRMALAGLARSVTALAPTGFWTGAERRYTYAVLNAVRREPAGHTDDTGHQAAAA